jgi:hypothetical protein
MYFAVVSIKNAADFFTCNFNAFCGIESPVCESLITNQINITIARAT